MSIYQRDGRWAVFCKDQKGKRYDKFFGRGDEGKMKAEAFDKAIEESKNNSWITPMETLLAQFTGVKENPKQTDTTIKESITFESLCNSYLDDLSISGRSSKHIGILKFIINSYYFTSMDKNKKADQFSYLDDIAPFLKSINTVSKITGMMRSQTTINRYGDYLDAIFNYGIRIGLITHNPVKGRRKAKEIPRAVKLTVEDILRIIEVAEPHVKWGIEVCFNLGTRSGESELLSLKWGDVDFANGEVLIYASKTKSYRKVPVTSIFLQRLKEVYEVSESEYVVEYRGGPIKSLRKGFKTACQNAGITYPVRMYDLRHMFATTMLANGADLAAVSKLMGHSRVTMTANVYYQYMQGEKERAVNLLPVLKAV